MSPRRKAKRPANVCSWCGARVRWATDEDSQQRIPLDVGTTTTGTRYVIVPTGPVDVAIRLLNPSERAGHADHRSHCRSSEPHGHADRRDLD